MYPLAFLQELRPSLRNRPVTEVLLWLLHLASCLPILPSHNARARMATNRPKLKLTGALREDTLENCLSGLLLRLQTHSTRRTEARNRAIATRSRSPHASSVFLVLESLSMHPNFKLRRFYLIISVLHRVTTTLLMAQLLSPLNLHRENMTVSCPHRVEMGWRPAPQSRPALPVDVNRSIASPLRA